MTLVASLYNEQFMKNDNFRRPIVENEVQNHENGSGCMQQSSLCPILHFVDFDWEKCIKNGLKWHILRVPIMQNPIPQVSSLYNKWFLKNQNFRQKFHIFVDFWLGKMHWNFLNGAYLGFEACQIQWHLLQVSTIKQFMKNDNFRRHIVENGVSKTMKMGWNISSSPPCGPILHFVDFDWEKCIKMTWVAHT